MEEKLLALFPLNTVLFPGMPLPLHVFEERYKLMIGRCVDEQRPFGIVLIRSGAEVGAPAVPCAVGTTARIASLKRLENGRMNLMAVGQGRFRIVEVVREEPYLVARVVDHHDGAPEPDARATALSVHADLQIYLRDLFTLLDQPPEELEIPTESERLSLFAAAVLQIPMPERQQLLEMTSVVERLRQEQEWLTREREKQQTLLLVRKQLGAVTPMDGSRLIGQISLN